MTSILEKWNKQWKANRLRLLFSNLGEEEKDFFGNLEIVTVRNVEHHNEYSDEGAYYDYVIVMKDTRDNVVYEIPWEEGSRGSMEIVPADEIEYESDYEDNLKSWSDFFEKNISDWEKERAYCQNITNTLQKFPFRQIYEELLQEQVGSQLVKEKEQSVGLQCVDVEFKDGDYYMVFNNGSKVPYKKEETLVQEME